MVQLLPVGGGGGTASLPGRAGTQPPEFTEHMDHQTLIPGCMWSSFSAGLVALGAQASGLPSCPGVLRTSESSLRTQLILFSLWGKDKMRRASSTSQGQVGTRSGRGLSLALGPNSFPWRQPGSRRHEDQPLLAAESSQPLQWAFGAGLHMHTHVGSHVLLPSRRPALLYLETSPPARNCTYNQRASSSSG